MEGGESFTWIALLIVKREVESAEGIVLLKKLPLVVGIIAEKFNVSLDRGEKENWKLEDEGMVSN